MNSNFTQLKNFNVSDFDEIKSDNLSLIPYVSNDVIKISDDEKVLIITKLIEAHKLAYANIKAGNITKRGFATNILTSDNMWVLGTNFNNTRNDISSICGERASIISAYNTALIKYANNLDGKFNFKIKYLAMAQGVKFEEITTPAIPCEDCLSWLNTNRYFDDDTVIFSFKKDENGALCLCAIKLIDLLPYRNILTSNKINDFQNVELTKGAKNSLDKLNADFEKLILLLKNTAQIYNNNSNCTISNQNIACSILANDEIFSAKKIDWTKRWNLEPLEFAVAKAIEKFGDNLKISAISYFGDEYSNDEFLDKVVSIKSLGRIRQKYANPDTLLILNLENKILITTVGEYLPKKFKHGYKI